MNLAAARHRYRLMGIVCPVCWIGSRAAAFAFAAGPGVARQGVAWRGAARQHVIPTERGAISLGQPLHRESRRCRAWRGLERHGNTQPAAVQRDNFRGASWRGSLGQCSARRGMERQHVTGDGNPGHFPKNQEAPAQRGATVEGMTQET